MTDISKSATLRCWAEVDLPAIRWNIGKIRSRIPQGTGILAVLKADAYGHGARQVAAAIVGDVEALAVANATEAAALEPTPKDIFLLSPCLPSERRMVVEADWILVVSSAAEAAAYGTHGPCRVHFKVDTGMGRIGCWHEEALGEFQKILALPRIEVHSVSSHLARADDDPDFTRDQFALFREFTRCVRELAPTVQTHIANSAGILGHPVGTESSVRPGLARPSFRFPHSDFRIPESLVRPGLALYGIAPTGDPALLRPALTWKSRIALVRDLPAGRTVSYGGTFTTPHPLRMAVVAAGYADGYPRQVSGQGAEVLIGGARCPVLGRVTMDLLLADISRVPQAQPGDEVVLAGRQGQQEIPISELAQRASTIPWHILTGLTSRVTRIYA